MSLGSTPRAAPPPETGCRGSPHRGYTPTMTRKPSENPAPPAGRIVAYDALRVLAILTVVAIHTLMPYRSVLPDTAPIRVLDDVLHYAVPLFVFISGALVWARPWRGGKGAYREFVAKRLGVIGLPYLAWAALYAVLYVERSADGAAALLRVPGLVASGHIWYHLYFIPMLLTFYLLTPVASRAARWSPETLLAAAYVLRIVAGPVLTDAASGLHPLFGQYATHVLSHLPHMALGAWFALRLPILPRMFTSAWPLMLAGGVISLATVSARGLPDWPLELQRLVFPGAMAATVVGMALGAIAARATLCQPGRAAHADGIARVRGVLRASCAALAGRRGRGRERRVAVDALVVHGGRVARGERCELRGERSARADTSHRVAGGRSPASPIARITVPGAPRRGIIWRLDHTNRGHA